jgi:hypothetical protein
MATPTYQITTHNVDTQFGKKAEQSISANQTWQDVAARMADSPDAHMGYALDSLAGNGRYEFHDAQGNHCIVVNHKAL